MDKKQIEQWARDASMNVKDNDDYEEGIAFECGIAALERFAALVATHEREQCALAADTQWVCDPQLSGGDAIRARSA